MHVTIVSMSGNPDTPRYQQFNAGGYRLLVESEKSYPYEIRVFPQDSIVPDSPMDPNAREKVELQLLLTYLNPISARQGLKAAIKLFEQGRTIDMFVRLREDVDVDETLFGRLAEEERLVLMGMRDSAEPTN